MAFASHEGECEGGFDFIFRLGFLFRSLYFRFVKKDGPLTEKGWVRSVKLVMDFGFAFWYAVSHRDAVLGGNFTRTEEAHDEKERRCETSCRDNGFVINRRNEFRCGGKSSSRPPAC